MFKDLRKFNCYSTDENKIRYLHEKNSYKALLKRKQYLFTIGKVNDLRHKANTSTKQFWGELRSLLRKNKKTINNITCNEWFTYFKDNFQLDANFPSLIEKEMCIYINDEQ